MKKILALILPVIILCGCGKISKQQKDISTYFPYYENKINVYTYNNSNYKDEKIYTMYETDNKMQSKIDMGSVSMIKIFQNVNGELKSKNVTVDNCHLENMLDTNFDDAYTEIKEPLEVGTSWNLPEVSGAKKQITNMNAKIETEYANFDNAMEITTTWDNENMTTKDYYVPGIGLVKSISQTSADPIILQLSKIIDNTAYESHQKIYLVDENNEKLVTKTFDLKLFTNDDVNEKILSAMKENNLVTSAAKINKFEVDRSNQDSIINIDFNSNFIDLTKLGASSETLTLQAIVNTFGHIYGVDKIKLTVDGKNYESGHILMEDGDLFDVK